MKTARSKSLLMNNSEFGCYSGTVNSPNLSRKVKSSFKNFKILRKDPFSRTTNKRGQDLGFNLKKVGRRKPELGEKKEEWGGCIYCAIEYYRRDYILLPSKGGPSS